MIQSQVWAYKYEIIRFITKNQHILFTFIYVFHGHAYTLDYFCKKKTVPSENAWMHLQYFKFTALQVHKL